MARRKVWKPADVIVEWFDAVEYPEMSGTRSSVVDRAKLAIRETPGWLIHQDEYRTILSRHYDKPLLGDDEPQVDSPITIPTGWVLKIRYRNRPGRKPDAQPKAEEGTAKVLDAPA